MKYHKWCFWYCQGKKRIETGYIGQPKVQVLFTKLLKDSRDRFVFPNEITIQMFTFSFNNLVKCSSILSEFVNHIILIIIYKWNRAYDYATVLAFFTEKPENPKKDV